MPKIIFQPRLADLRLLASCNYRFPRGRRPQASGSRLHRRRTPSITHVSLLEVVVKARSPNRKAAQAKAMLRPYHWDAFRG